MKRRITALLGAVLMLSLCGCGEDKTSSEVSSPDSLSSTEPNSNTGGEPVVVDPLEDQFYTPNYLPNAAEWNVASVEITGEYGQETDALIPSVFIYCNEEIGREIYSECTVQIDATMTDEYASTNVLGAEIRGRGHSTWEWPKKPYKIKLNEKESLLGMTASKEWALIANYADESMVRNIAGFAMSEALGSFEFTPVCVPVNVYVNGVYQGIYTLTEQIEAKESRLQIDYREDNANTGYLLEIGGADPETDLKGQNCFDLPSGCAKDILIKAPKDEKLTEDKYDYIYRYICVVDEKITTLSDYETYIDVESFIDWFLVHELTYNLDSCFHRSCYMMKDRGGKLKLGPVWDFDLAFGNMYMDNPNYDDWATVGSSNSNSYIHTNWFNYLMADETFRSKARARWAEVKDTMMNAAFEAIDEAQLKMEPSVEDNFAVWDTLEYANGFQPVAMERCSTYSEQVQYVRRFITNRAEWITNNL